MMKKEEPLPVENKESVGLMKNTRVGKVITNFVTTTPKTSEQKQKTLNKYRELSFHDSDKSAHNRKKTPISFRSYNIHKIIMLKAINCSTQF